MGSAFVIICLAVFSEVIDGYLLTRPRNTVALLGDRVELDCITNTSHLLTWHVRRHGSQADEWISLGNDADQNISDSFRILRKETGQFVLVVDPVLMSLAGRYECNDGDEEEPSHAEVTLLSTTRIDISPNIAGSHAVRTAAEYEEMQETDQQSLGLPVYQNLRILQTEYQQLEMIDQQSQHPRN